MKFHFQQAIRAFILLAFCAMLFNMHHTGEITKFINPKYESLSQLASILFLILFLIQVTRIWTAREEGHHHHHHHDHCHDHSCTHDHGDSTFNLKKLVSYSVILVPLLTGFFLPPKTLDAAVASKKGGMELLANHPQSTKKEEPIVQEEAVQSTGEEISIPEFDIQDPMKKAEYDELIQLIEKSQTVKMDDRVYNAFYEEIHKDLKKYQGRTIELKGFVYKEEGFSQDQLVISRFLITHCVADASIIGFLTEMPEASSLEVNTWIDVKGVIDITTYNGMELPVIKITEWEKTAEPTEPYIYPITIQLI